MIGLGDDNQPEALAHLGQNAQPLQPQSLEGIGRGARLESSGAEKAHPEAGHQLGHGEGLLGAFHRAWSGHYGQLGAANRGVGSGKVDYRVLGFDLAADQLVGLADAQNFLHARQVFENRRLVFARVANDGDAETLGAGADVRPQTERLDLSADSLHLVFRWHAPALQQTWGLPLNTLVYSLLQQRRNAAVMARPGPRLSAPTPARLKQARCPLGLHSKCGVRSVPSGRQCDCCRSSSKRRANAAG